MRRWPTPGACPRPCPRRCRRRPAVSDAPLWIGEQEAAELLSLEDAIDVLADAYRLQAAGSAASMRRAHLREGDAILHAVGGTIAADGLTGTKTWAYTPGGASPVL